MERTLPHSLDAERSVLGAIILHNDAYAQCSQIIVARDFFRIAHLVIYETIVQLLEAPGGSVDLVTLCGELSRRGLLGEAGGPAYISALIDGVPRSTNVRQYAAIVQEKSRLRNVIYAANLMTEAAYDEQETSAEILRKADLSLLRIQQTGQDVALQRVQHDALLSRLEYNVAHKGELRGVDTGFESINRSTFGWRSGDIVVLGARPSIGKSTLAVNFAVAAARSQRPDTGQQRHVAIFSMEMTQEQIEWRMLSYLSGVPLTTIEGGWMSDTQWGPIAHSVGELSELNIHIDDSSRVTPSDVRSKCRALKAEHGLDLVVIDYIQLMTSATTRKGGTRNEELSEISRTLKITAGELGVPMLVLSQLSRPAPGREKYPPQLSDLRDSGAIEQDADIVCFLHRESHRANGQTVFILEKQRNGPTGTVNLSINRDTATFTDAGEGPEELPPPVKTEQEKQDARTQAIIRNRAKRR